MKSVRFDRLLASTALGLVLMFSQAAFAQQTEDQKIDAALGAAIPAPDNSVPLPTAKDFVAEPQAASAKPAEPTKTAEPVKVEPAPAPTQNATAPAAEPAKPAVTADSAVSDKLRELVTGKQLDRLGLRKNERAAIESFYTGRNFAPLWVANGAAAPRATAAIGYLNRADEVALDPSDYPTPSFTAGMSTDAMAEAELRLTASALTFARHAQVGRIHYTRIAADIAFNQVAPEPADVLAKLASDTDAAKALDSYNPPMAEFAALRAKLAEARKNASAVVKPEEKKKAAGEGVRVPDGKILRPGMKDSRVVALRKRLDIAGDKDNPLYDDKVAEAVKGFQAEADLDTDGNLGPNTVRALNGGHKETPRAAQNVVDTIVVNMERWRWFPRDLGNPHVIVNVPDYTLTLWNNDKVYWHTRIVAGKPGNHATPMTSAEMKFITVNPTWNVPPSIIENEYLPALQQDPGALERIGLKVEQNPDGTIRIYQPPGAGNALGRIRFNFPNKFLVYQHDTPDKHLFAKEKRAFSHGCMRVQNPLTYGEKLLSLALPNERYTEARLEKMFGGSEININFPKPIWVHLTYQTAFVDADGKLQIREDVYGRDARMIAILKGSERRVADLAIERPPSTSAKPVRMPAGMYRGNSYYSGPGFFEFLFGGGGPRYQEAPPRPRRGVGSEARAGGRYYYER